MLSWRRNTAVRSAGVSPAPLTSSGIIAFAGSRPSRLIRFLFAYPNIGQPGSTTPLFGKFSGDLNLRATLIMRPIKNHANLLERHQPAADHFIELRQHFLDAFR